MIDSLRELLSRLRSFLHKRERDEDLEAELSAHLELAIHDNMRQGMSAQEARRVALVDLGGVEQAKELHRGSRGLPTLDSILQDLRYCFRTLRRDAALTTFATLIVGLGVAASATVFSICNALLLRPLPFKDPSSLVWIANGESANLSAQTVQVANLQDLQAQSQSFAALAAYSPFYGAGDIRLTGGGEPERLTGVPVSQDFFPMLGVQPHGGRLFSPEECGGNGPKAVLLAHRFWERRMHSDPDVVGHAITLDGASVTVAWRAARFFRLRHRLCPRKPRRSVPAVSLHRGNEPPGKHAGPHRTPEARGDPPERPGGGQCDR